MTPIKPNVDPQGKYNSKQTAEALGIHRETLRRWTASGKIRKVICRATMMPRYQGAEIIKVWSSDF